MEIVCINNQGNFIYSSGSILIYGEEGHVFYTCMYNPDIDGDTIELRSGL